MKQRGCAFYIQTNVSSPSAPVLKRREIVHLSKLTIAPSDPACPLNILRECSRHILQSIAQLRAVKHISKSGDGSRFQLAHHIVAVEDILRADGSDLTPDPVWTRTK